MHRSAHPLHSGSPTNAGVSVKPQHLISLTNVVAVYWLPQSWRSATPRATFGAIDPNARVIPCRIGSSSNGSSRDEGVVFRGPHGSGFYLTSSIVRRHQAGRGSASA